MINQQQMCDDQQLLQMLHSDSDSFGDNQTIEHVESCVRCQNRLDQLAADEGEWQRTVEVLSSNAHDQVQGGGSLQTALHIPPLNLQSVAWTDAMAEQLLSPPAHPEMLGRIGRYDVERLIGSGGMGVVFKAYDTELNRPVAVKLLAPYLASSGAARNRFAREARAAAAVVDEHVVSIHNVESDEERPFLVMKYIAGGSLQQRIDREGPLEVCEVLRIGMHTAKGLAAAHAQGLIHRDVKPSNILLDEGVDRALLTDFGLARATDDASLTRSGFHPGTPHYMSPEQVRGEEIDGRSDLFSLGCVLYALCTGHPPFRADTSYAVLRRITDDTPRPIRDLNADIPEWLEQVIMKLLSKFRDDRFDSAEQVAEILEDCLAHVQHPTTAPLPEAVAVLSPKESNRPLWFKFIAAAVLGFAMLLAGTIIYLETGKGTLLIETNSDSDIPIVIRQGDKIVEHLTVSQVGAKAKLKAGNYIIEIEGDDTKFEVKGNEVSLSRGGSWIATISENSKITTDNSRTQYETRSKDKISQDHRIHNLPADTQVHVVGCYEAKDDHPIDVKVKATGKPMVVVLNSYFAASWNLHIDPEADVRGVILAGYFDQRFSHKAPKKEIPTITSTYFPTWEGITGAERRQRMDKSFYVWSPLETADFTKMQTVLKKMTGRQLTTFQGIYTGQGFLIDGRLGTKQLDIAKRWQSYVANSDTSSLKFGKIEGELKRIRIDDEHPIPVDRVTKKMDEFGVPKLELDVTELSGHDETQKEKVSDSPALSKPPMNSRHIVVDNFFGDCKAISKPTPEAILLKLEEKWKLEPNSLFNLYEKNRDDFQFDIVEITNENTPSRTYPVFGFTYLHKIQYKCTVSFTETVKAAWPVPFVNRAQKEDVVYITVEHLHSTSSPKDIRSPLLKVPENEPAQAVINLIVASQQQDIEAIKRYAKGSPASEESQETFREILGETVPEIQDTWLANHDAIVFTPPLKTSSEQTDGRQLLFTLKQVEGRWLVIDIDLETKQGLLEEVERFKKEHPEAEKKMVAPSALQFRSKFIGRWRRFRSDGKEDWLLISEDGKFISDTHTFGNPWVSTTGTWTLEGQRLTMKAHSIMITGEGFDAINNKEEVLTIHDIDTKKLITKGASQTDLVTWRRQTKRLEIRKVFTGEFKEKGIREAFSPLQEDGMYINSSQDPLLTEDDIEAIELTEIAHEAGADKLLKLSFSLTDEANQRLLAKTSEKDSQSSSNYLLITFDGRRVALPKVMEPISKKLELVGLSDRNLAEEIVKHVQISNSAVSASPRSTARALSPEHKALQGTWSLSKQQVDGESKNGFTKYDLTIDGTWLSLDYITKDGRTSASKDASPNKYRYTINTETTPHQLTWYGKGLLIQAVFRCDGDTLEIAHLGRAEIGRPDSFDHQSKTRPENTPLLLWTLKRKPIDGTESKDNASTMLDSQVIDQDQSGTKNGSGAYRQPNIPANEMVRNNYFTGSVGAH